MLIRNQERLYSIRMIKNLNSVMISGKEVLPLIEGGKGVAVTNGLSSGSWAATGGVGTFSGVNADNHRKDGSIIRQNYKGRNRKEAIQRTLRSLDEFVLEGITTTIALHKKILNHKKFIDSDFDVNWLMKEKFF